MVRLGYVGLPLAAKFGRGLRTEQLIEKLAPRARFIDVKSQFNRNAVLAAGHTVWRL